MAAETESESGSETEPTESKTVQSESETESKTGPSEASTTEAETESAASETKSDQAGEVDRSPSGHGVVAKGLRIEVADGRDTRVLLNDFSFECPAGTVTALTGPSGSGKTTLLTCLAGVSKFQGGTALVGGQERRPGKLAKPKQLREIGIMFQDYRLVRSLNVVDNVALPLHLDGWTWRSARRPAVDLLEQLGLGGHLKKRPSSLSGGEQQRVALARAVVTRPQVLLADEPSAHLDRDSADLLISYLLGLAEWGAAVVVSTHDPRLLASCQQQVTLK